MRIQAWAPGHATLFFSVPQRYEETNQKGSLGAGFNFDTGVLTSIEKSDTDQVFWNSIQIDGVVTLTAVNRFRELTGFTGNINVYHQSELKIGHGLSTSGAGALGTVIALNSLVGSHLSEEELYQIAHYADIVNHTGLGSVMGQITRGIEIRKKIGGPGVGETVSIDADDEVIILMIDKLKTSDVLVSEEQMKQVTETGMKMTEEVNTISNPTARYLIQLGKKFARSCGLITSRVEKVLSDLEAMGEENVTMAMIGETLIVLPENSLQVVEYAFNHRIDTVVTKISSNLPSIIE